MGRKQAIPGEELKERKLRMSDRGWSTIRSIAQGLGYRGIAPLLEAVVRGEAAIVPTKNIAPTVDK